MNTRIQDLSTTRLLTGGALIAAGALVALRAVGLLHFLDLARSWPLFVIVLAFVKIGATLRERHQQGWGLLLAGDWLLANAMTDWAYVQFSVPMLLAGFGLVTIIRGLRDRDHSRMSDENSYATQ
jgi:cell wall-active antibiotic response 4TMS protein YvqF